MSQNTNGLSEPFQVEVDGRMVTCAWIPANYFASDPTNNGVMNEIARRGLRCPGRRVADAVFDLFKLEMATNPSVAIDGHVRTNLKGIQVVGHVAEDHGGRGQGESWLFGTWCRDNRFLVVVSDEPA